MTMNEAISSQVKMFLAKYVDVPYHQISDDMKFHDCRMKDIDYLELICDIEDQFEIQFPAAVWSGKFKEQFKTVENLVMMINELVDNKTKAA